MRRGFGAGYNRHTARNKIFVAAILIGVSIASFGWGVLLIASNTEASVKPSEIIEPQDMAVLFVASHEIPAGTSITTLHLREERRPRVGLPKNAVTDAELIRGLYARSTIEAGAPLITDYFTTVRPINQITASIPAGFRAVTIRVDDKSSVEGWVRPGSTVDVVWSSILHGKPSLTTIVESAKVISVERQAKSENGGDAGSNPAGSGIPSTITLLTSAEDSAKIQLAQTSGSLSLNLRGDADGSKGGTRNTLTIDDLLGGRRVDDRLSRVPNIQGTVKIREKDGSTTKMLLVDGALQPE